MEPTDLRLVSYESVPKSSWETIPLMTWLVKPDDSPPPLSLPVGSFETKQNSGFMN